MSECEWTGQPGLTNPSSATLPPVAVSLFDVDISDPHKARQSVLTDF